jgi:sugar phosphate isomerase/epimerase
MLLGCIVKDPGEVGHCAGLPVDYLELKGDMLCVDGPGLRDIGARLSDTGLPATAMTSPLPRHFRCRVVGDDADHARALEVFQVMCDRAAPLGVRTVVLGSGQARNIPPGFPPEKAVSQFGAFVTGATAQCASRGMTLTLEPLTAAETNFVNSCAQARPLVDALTGTGLRIAVDCYHVFCEGLSPTAEVKAAQGVIGHAHTSSLPRGSLDYREDVQAEFVAALGAAGYDGGLTIEEQFSDFAREAPAAVGVFRRILAPPV